MSVNSISRATVVALSPLVLAGCTLIADFAQYGPGAAGGGGQGGRGGGDGDGGSAQCPATNAYAMTTDPLIPIQDACVLAGNQTAINASQNEVEIAPEFEGASPFPFCFYGKQIEGFWVGDNGYVGLGLQPPNALAASVGDPHPLDVSGLPEPGILPFWENLRAGSDGVCVALTEAAPNRILWVTWKGACIDQGVPCSGASDLTFSVGIEETSHKIYFGYPSMMGSTTNLQDRADGLTATIGVVNDGEPGCPVDECNTEGRCPDSTPCGYTQFSAQTVTNLTALEFSPN